MDDLCDEISRPMDQLCNEGGIEMKLRTKVLQVAWVVVLLGTAPLSAGNWKPAPWKSGGMNIRSAGPLTFGPQGVLFIGDTQGGMVFAVATGEKGPARKIEYKVAGLSSRVAALLGTTPREITINDLAVCTDSGRAFISVSRGRGPDAAPAILRVGEGGKLSVFKLDKAEYASTALGQLPAEGAKDRRGRSKRRESITDLAYVRGNVLVAGLSNEEFASSMRSIPYPFKKSGKAASIEIYHGAHGRFETRSPVRTFVPFDLGDDTLIYAAYTCTPLVRIKFEDLKPGVHLKGVTVAELGNHNRPLDMIAYKKDNKDYLLIANSARGIMKVPAGEIPKAAGITSKVSGGKKKGVGYETIEGWKGVVQLDQLDDERCLIIQEGEDGSLQLVSRPLP